MVLEIGGADTLPAFTENLRGHLAGRREGIRGRLPGGLRLGPPGRQDGAVPRHRERASGARNCPELNDEFAQELGDYRDRGRAARGRPQGASSPSASARRSRRPRTRSWISWWMRTSFPVPEAFVERQIRSRVEQSLRAMAAEGIDPRSLKLDWEKVKESQRDKAVREVKASLLLAPHRGARGHRRHARRGGPRSRTCGARSSASRWRPCRCVSRRMGPWAASPARSRPRRR